MPTALGNILSSALSTVVPPHVAVVVLKEARVGAEALLRHPRARRKLAGRTGVLANLGAGASGRPDWINLDIGAGAHVTWWDCRRGLPFDDGAVAAIFTEHMFEHLDYRFEAPRLLRECHRCLSPTGVLRIVVPDAERYLRLYGEDWQKLAATRQLSRADGGWRDPWLGECYTTQMELINAVFRQNGEHKYAYDGETLAKMLRGAGFGAVVVQQFGVSLRSDLALDRPERASESLYVEAMK